MRTRPIVTTAVAALAAAFAAPSAATADSAPGSGPGASEMAREAQLKRANATAQRLRVQLRKERTRHARSLARMRAVSLARPSVNHALSLGAAAYGVPAGRLRSVALCESGLNPMATNGVYHGLFQFGSRLWNATPYRAFSRSDPYAASFAAAWAFSRGMSRHWPVCGR